MKKPSWATDHPQKKVRLYDVNVWVDRKMASLLCVLNNELGCKTNFSCQGSTNPKRGCLDGAYISFEDRDSARFFFDLIADEVEYVQWESKTRLKSRGRGACVRFYHREIRRVLRVCEEAAAQTREV